LTGPGHAEVAPILAWLRANAPALSARSHADLQLDSRRVMAGDIFVAVPSVVAGGDDGRRYLREAQTRGAAAALVEAEHFGGADAGLPILPVRDLRRVLGPLAARYYGQPSEAMQVVGVTGTNGKTSTAFWIAQMLSRAGTRCAVLGTVGSGFPGETLADAALTTPDAIALQREVLRLRDAGARALAMEVSSIGLDQGRVDGMHFDVAVFTNLTRDHLDYHGTMPAYEAAKVRLFDWPTLTAAVLNLDAAAGRRLAGRLAGRVRSGALRVAGFTTAPGEVDAASAAAITQLISARDIRATATGLEFTLQCGHAEHKIELGLVGSFNVSNLMAAVGAALACGIDLDLACRAAPQLVPPPGRMQRVRTRSGDEPLVVVDYAHTADAIEQALLALRPQAAARGGRLWIVFGAGGERDPGKRAPMGAAAGSHADRLVITSDNPRREDPAAIVADVAAGVRSRSNVDVIVDRAQAIAHALSAADARDIVLIAGKGHEASQDIGGVKRPFSDAEQARAALGARAGVTC
jgi:UDP-N-acetylmuramoyl-L-alanyl-D-glutamate--2,6-diaminopimelate ligase